MGKSRTILILIFLISGLIFTVGCETKKSVISVDNPLPDEAFKAEIAVVDPIASLKANSASVVKVKVKNLSNSTWPSERGKYPIAYHWLDKNGKEMVYDGERTPLPNDLGSGKETLLDTNVMTPNRAGKYI